MRISRSAIVLACLLVLAAVLFADAATTTRKKRHTTSRRLQKAVAAKPVTTTKPRMVVQPVLQAKLNPAPPKAPFLYNGFDYATGAMIQTADDGVATIMWNSNKTQSGQWLVTWGPQGGSQKIINAPYNTIQLQPLDAGVTYQVSVQTVNATGHVSIPSDVLLFQSNSSRVDAMRAQAPAAFFDDFNLVAGAPDEKNWRTSYIYCDDPAYNALFINSQRHVHNVVSTWDMSPQSPTLKDIYAKAILEGDKRMLNALAVSKKVCDKATGQVVARTTRFVDFSGGKTATISFDFDGAFGSNYWFLDFVEPGTGDRFTALHQRGEIFEYRYIPVNVNDSGVIQNKPSKIGITLLRNVRRHFTMQVSQDKVAVFLDGKLLLHSDWALTGRTPLPKTRAFLMFRQTTRETRQRQNLPFLTVHWDNFFFSPASPADVVTHVYNITDRSAGYTDVGLGYWDNSIMYFPISDSIIGANPKARLHYSYSGSMPSDMNVQHIYVNGFKVPLTVDKTIDGQGVFTEFDASYLIQGQNKIKWWLPRQAIRVGNVRIELDFPAALEPAYNQRPKGWFEPMSAEYGFHAIKEHVGLSAVVKSVGPYGTGSQGDGGPPFLFAPYDAPQGANLEWNGTYTISYGLNCGIQLISLGRCYGARNITLYLRKFGTEDKPTILDQYVFPAPGTNGVPEYGVINWGNTFKLNTLKLENGTSYELWVEAFDALGTPAIPEYFDGSHWSGEYFPVYIYKVNKPPPEDPPSPLAAKDVAPSLVKTPTLVGESATNGSSVSSNSPVDASTPSDNNRTVPARMAKREAAFTSLFDLGVSGAHAMIASAAKLTGAASESDETSYHFFSRLAKPVPAVHMSENDIRMLRQLHERASYVPTADGHQRGIPQVLETEHEVSAVVETFRRDLIEEEEAEKRGEMSRRQKLMQMGVGTIMG